MEGGDLDVRDAFRDDAEHVEALFDGEMAGFFVVFGDRHDEMVKYPRGAVDQVEVPVGGRVETSRIQSDTAWHVPGPLFVFRFS